jgi:hypothetical protein
MPISVMRMQQTERQSAHSSCIRSRTPEAPRRSSLYRHSRAFDLGDVSEGIRQAVTVYEPLVSERQTTMLDTLAMQVLNSVPVEARKRSDVDEYRALVGLPPRR